MEPLLLSVIECWFYKSLASYNLRQQCNIISFFITKTRRCYCIVKWNIILGKTKISSERKIISRRPWGWANFKDIITRPLSVGFSLPAQRCATKITYTFCIVCSPVRYFIILLLFSKPFPWITDIFCGFYPFLSSMNKRCYK